MKSLTTLFLFIFIFVPLAGDHILITGFGPFGRYDENVSYQALAPFDGEKFQGYTLRVIELTVAWSESEEQLLEAIEILDPQAVLSVGIDSRAVNPVVIETRAINRVISITDTLGELPPRRSIVPGGAEYLYSQVPAVTLQNALQKAGIDAALSWDPGRYLCGWIYYLALEALQDRPVLFIHTLPNINAEALQEAVRIILKEMINL